MLKLRRFIVPMVLLATAGCPNPPPLPNLPAPEYEAPRPFPSAAASALSTPAAESGPEAGPETSPAPPSPSATPSAPPVGTARPALEPGSKP